MFFAKTTDAMRRMLVARERIARRNPFFASIMFNAKLVETDQHNTIVTDGMSIFFNPEYVKGNDQFIEGDVLKAVMHGALQHIGRRKYREIDRWNQSATLSVGPLVHQYFKQHPSLMQHDGLFPDKAAEEIYELLEKQQDSAGGGGGKGKLPPKGEQPGGMVEPQPGQEEAAEQSAKQWGRAVANAMEKATKAGNMPGNIKRLVEELLPTEKVDWRDITRDMSRDAKSKTSRSWARPNRRRNDPMMPGYGDDNIYNLLIAFDVSGSVSKEMLRDMKSEIAALIDQDLVNTATLVAVDTQVHNLTVVTNSQGVEEWVPEGGGGTDFRSAMAIFKKEFPQAIGLIFLTDMETSSFGEDPGYPVVWVNFAPHNRAKAPFGRTVEY
jgi:predicted metal-dependent peptidase